ncbi:C1 protein [Bhendi yellow vein mosaic betasatellite [India:Kaivara:OYKaivara:2006]]|uniref:C1 protein n=1 Tax=Bhendi yellow vein mosaic betasatellite [India:Kaivara:OYKaivara:2006] TaxID=908074 RepID=E7BNC0_9VIRU|nr:C1 protein [Bhendi yellow vein mosaic betasatellite [India:Kaivara:OYKaivara:2006]]
MKISIHFIHTFYKNIYTFHLYIHFEHILKTPNQRTRFSKSREGIVFKVYVRLLQQQRMSVHTWIISGSSKPGWWNTYILEYTYQQVHTSFDFNGLEGTITSTYKLHYWGSKAEGILAEDIIQMVDITIIENPDIMGTDVNEPVTIDNEIII